MDTVRSTFSTFRVRRSVIDGWQVVFLFLFLGVGNALLFTTIQQALVGSFFLLVFVSVSGLVLCRNTQVSLEDPSLNILGYFWLIKLALTLFVLYAGWIPQLDSISSASWGYDPQRYYYQAQELIENSWSLSFASLNYGGILYYYGAIFAVFGHNPVIPALVNAFITLCGILFLIRTCYRFKPVRGTRDWAIAFLLLIPEVIWFDVMTSREALMAVLILLSTVAIGRYLFLYRGESFIKALVLSGLSLIGILAVRTTMIIPVVGAIALMVLLLKSKRQLGIFIKIIVLVCALGAIIAGPQLQQIIGGYEVDFHKTLRGIQSLNGNIASDMAWSSNSIAFLLLPNSMLQSFLYLLPRMVLYLAAPLPNISTPLPDLLAGNWSAWQRLMVWPTSVLNLLLFPYAVAGLMHAWRKRKEWPAPLVVHFAFWTTFIAIAAGNLIIHERYRLMMSVLLYSCVWLGYTNCTKKEVRIFACPWFGMLGAASVCYFIYKFV